MKIKVIPLIVLAIFVGLTSIGLMFDGAGKNNSYAPDAATEWGKLLLGFAGTAITVGLGLLTFLIANREES